MVLSPRSGLPSWGRILHRVSPTSARSQLWVVTLELSPRRAVVGVGGPSCLPHTPPDPVCLPGPVRPPRRLVSRVAGAPGFIVAMGRIYLLWSKSLVFFKTLLKKYFYCNKSALLI